MLVVAWIVWMEMLRRKDIYVLLILMGSVLTLLVSLNIFGLGGMVGYLQDLGLLAAWFIGWALTIAVNARQLPDEEQRGTMIPLLSKPLTRWDVLCGKWLGGWLVVSAANACFYVLILALVLFKGGDISVIVVAQGFTLHCVSLGVLGALVILLSTRLNADAATALGWVLALLCYFVMPNLPTYLSLETGWRAAIMLFLYHALPHLDVFDARVLVAHGLHPVPWGLFGGVLCYGAALIASCLFLAWLVFRNKLFSRADRM